MEMTWKSGFDLKLTLLCPSGGLQLGDRQRTRECGLGHIYGWRLKLSRLVRELKKKEAERAQLIINNKHVLQKQQYTINLLEKERTDVLKIKFRN